MNLVQIQERLKDVPMPSLMEYANGGNPAVPPYLALSELKRRETMTQSAQGQQAAQQGRMPSVKDQVEQAAGLATLQKQMQAQGLQSLMAQARPQSIPENIPQPSRAAESEGVAGLPTGDMYNFADGGIVAFAAGGDEGLTYRAALKEREQRGFEKALREAYETDPLVLKLEAQRKRAMQSNDVQRATEIQQQIDAVKSGRARAETVSTPMVPVAPLEMETQRDVGISTGTVPPLATMQRGSLPPPGKGVLSGDLSLEGLTPRARPVGAPQMAEQKQMPERTGIASIAGGDEAKKMLREAMRDKTTIEQIRAEQEKERGLYGLTQPFGEERMKRAQEMQAARQQALGSRDMERLMRVLGGGAAGGLGGMGQAYLAAMEGERIADQKFRERMDELLYGVEEKRRAEATTGMTDAQKRKARKEEMAIGAAEKIMDVDTKFKLQELQAKSTMGRLSPEDQYIMAEIAKGRSYPEIVAKIAEAKAGPRAETAEQQRFKDTYLKVAKAYDEMLAKPEGVSRDEYIRREVERAMGMVPIGGTSGAAVPQQAIDYLKKNPNLAAQFDAKYGAGASAKYLGR